VNYFSSAVENCYSTLAINSTLPIDDYDDVVGINCFDELLIRSEFIAYARDKFKYEINKGTKLLFFSKRLNVYINDGHGVSINNLNNYQNK
jgi:hypothetical protein